MRHLWVVQTHSVRVTEVFKREVFLSLETKPLNIKLHCHELETLSLWLPESSTHLFSLFLSIPFPKYKATSKGVSKNASAYMIENSVISMKECVHHTSLHVIYSEKTHAQKMFLSLFF